MINDAQIFSQNFKVVAVINKQNNKNKNIKIKVSAIVLIININIMNNQTKKKTDTYLINNIDGK